MKIAFFGTPPFVDSVLKVLRENFEVVLEVRGTDQPTSQLVNQLTKLEPDLLVVAAYGKIISKEILEIPKYGALNIHPSLLPKYRGATPIQSAILNGDETSGITIIKMDVEVDHGLIVFQEKFELSKQDTFDSLSKEMFQLSSEFLPQVIRDFVGGEIQLLGQDDAIAVYCPRLTRQDGYFEIDNPPTKEKLDRMIRAYYPWPTAWTRWKEKIVKFLPSGLVQMEGKKAVPLKDFLNGYPDFPLKEV